MLLGQWQNHDMLLLVQESLMISIQISLIGDAFFQDTFTAPLSAQISESSFNFGASGQLETGQLLGSTRVSGCGTQRQAGYVKAASAVYQMLQSFIAACRQNHPLHVH